MLPAIRKFDNMTGEPVLQGQNQANGLIPPTTMNFQVN